MQENIKKPYSHSILDFHHAIWGEEFGQDPFVTYNTNTNKYKAYKK